MALSGCQRKIVCLTSYQDFVTYDKVWRGKIQPEVWMNTWSRRVKSQHAVGIGPEPLSILLCPVAQRKWTNRKTWLHQPTGILVTEKESGAGGSKNAARMSGAKLGRRKEARYFLASLCYLSDEHTDQRSLSMLGNKKVCRRDHPLLAYKAPAQARRSSQARCLLSLQLY